MIIEIGLITTIFTFSALLLGFSCNVKCSLYKCDNFALNLAVSGVLDEGCWHILDGSASG